MILIFADNTELEIKNIHGGPKWVQGFSRDVLSIEVDPKVADLNKLQELFHNTEKTQVLKTKEIKKVQELVETDEIDEATKEKKKEMKEVEKEIVTVIGEYYTIYVGCQNEIREENQLTTSPSENPTVEINKVEIAQLTHSEKKMAEMEKMIQMLMKAQGK
jgi:hypothetical protein